MTNFKTTARTFLLATALALLAQAASAITPAERREELLKVQEMINDPDPLMRIANFEDVIRSKDAFKVETAIKIAMTSQDASLRSLATRAYFAAFRVVVFTPVLPPDLARQWENAGDDIAAQRRVAATHRSLATVAVLTERHAGKIRFLFTDVDPSKNQGTVVFTEDGVHANSPKVTYRVQGDRLAFTSSVRLGAYDPTCDVELRGTKDLKIVGTMNCSIDVYGPIGLESEMF